MGEIVDAIVGYAVTNRTNGFMVAHSNYANNADFNLFGHRLTRIAAGRPYLPCPDRDGDGFEDRVRAPYRPSALDRISPYPDNLTVNQIDVLTTTDRASFDPTDFPMSGPTTGNRQLPFGECEAHSGFLPYNTLGIKHGDPWGSKHTYIVNPNFSTGAIGFDQQTRGHQFTPLYETNFVTSAANHNLRAVVGSLVTGTGSARRLQMERPLLACHYRNEHSNCWQDISYPTVINTFHEKGFETSTGSARSLRADGVVNTFGTNRPSTPFYAPNYARHPQIGGVNDGLPFAVISHGLNRLGAASAQRAGGALVCVPFYNPNYTHEQVNSGYNNCGVHFITQSGRIYSNDNRFIGSASPTSIFVFASSRSATTANETFVGINTSKHTPTHFNFGDDFDDLVTWLTRRELVVRMHKAGVFPLPEKDVFRGFTSFFANYNL